MPSIWDAPQQNRSRPSRSRLDRYGINSAQSPSADYGDVGQGFGQQPSMGGSPYMGPGNWGGAFNTPGLPQGSGPPSQSSAASFGGGGVGAAARQRAGGGQSGGSDRSYTRRRSSQQSQEPEGVNININAGPPQGQPATGGGSVTAGGGAAVGGGRQPTPASVSGEPPGQYTPDQQTLMAQNPLAVQAAMGGNPLAQLVTGGLFRPDSRYGAHPSDLRGDDRAEQADAEGGVGLPVAPLPEEERRYPPEGRVNRVGASRFGGGRMY